VWVPLNEQVEFSVAQKDQLAVGEALGAGLGEGDGEGDGESVGLGEGLGLGFLPFRLRARAFDDERHAVDARASEIEVKNTPADKRRLRLAMKTPP
jgi:hypothetical protein